MQYTAYNCTETLAQIHRKAIMSKVRIYCKAIKAMKKA
jgi:hypothetical protein